MSCLTPKGEADVVILGAGIQGLAIATELTKRGVRVAIVARDLPEDVHSTAFASPWAGANWSPFEPSAATAQRDITTFNAFAQLSKEIPDLITRTEYLYYSIEDAPVDLWYKDIVFDYRPLKLSDLPPGMKSGVTFTSYTLNPPEYIGHLAKNLRAVGVPIIRARVSSLDEAYCLPSLGPVKLVVNATGLGSRTLLGVEDSLVHPVRGQTVLVRAPDVRACISIKRGLPKGQAAYIIPRPGPDGHLILGGTYLENQYSTLPDPSTGERILKTAYEICPALGDGKGWQNIDIISHNVGLRPARYGGIRLELEERKIGQGMEGRLGMLPAHVKEVIGQDVGVVHAYGIGPAGYQTSIGVGLEAADLVDKYLGRG
ncbi:hypothetical protein M231_03843 [Tremella mesenterica]|uniref:FAD dependent oxidoreductase domain-containing protein n=1 Tax=Tremella mesenterica TaxID=5217 RepID=A0A4Q1BM54_TREME|nr:hypothetical protein M231_03843 [Tremella mesenterica]